MAFQVDIKNMDAFKREVLEVPSQCSVGEVFQPWCGPCKAIISTFKRIYFDSGDRPLKFFTLYECYEGNPLTAIGWAEMEDPETLAIEKRKVAKP